MHLLNWKGMKSSSLPLCQRLQLLAMLLPCAGQLPVL